MEIPKTMTDRCKNCGSAKKEHKRLAGGGVLKCKTSLKSSTWEPWTDEEYAATVQDAESLYGADEGKRMKIEIPAGLKGDSGWRGAMYILNAPIFEYKGLESFVDLEKHSFHCGPMLKQCRGFSSGEYLMLQVAASLFNRDTKINLWDLVGTLDHNNLQVVLDAIAISAGIKKGEGKDG